MQQSSRKEWRIIYTGLIICFTFALFLVPFMARAYNVPVRECFYDSNTKLYYYIEDDGAEIHQPSSVFWYGDIPERINGYPVTAIGSHAFDSCVHLTTVTIPQTVKSIGARAFQASSLVSIRILSDDIEIGEEAFRHTSFETNESNWTNDVLYIGNHLIKAKTSISGTYSIIPGTKTIADGAFSECNQLSHVDIPDSVIRIGCSAFFNCSGLMDISIPERISTIRSSTFSGCAKLSEITIPNNIIKIESNAFFGCTGLSELSIPNSVITIGAGAFENCSNIQMISLPDSLQVIGEDAFTKTGYYNNKSNWEDNVLYINHCLIKADRNLLGEYSIKQDTIVIADYAFSECSRVTGVVVPNRVTQISNGAFYQCSALEHVKLHTNIKSIGSRAFYYCYKLSNISLPNSVITIGSSAFYHCKSLTYIRIPDQITRIEGSTFYETGLTSVYIPQSVLSISYGAFDKCENLLNVYHGGSEAEWSSVDIKEGSDNVSTAIHYYNSEPTDSMPLVEYYDIVVGKLDNYVTTVITNGEGNYISEITVNGKTYSVKKNLIVDDLESIRNKNVVFSVSDGKVIWFEAVEKLINNNLEFYCNESRLPIIYTGNAISSQKTTLKIKVYNSSTMLNCDPASLVIEKEGDKTTKAKEAFYQEIIKKINEAGAANLCVQNIAFSLENTDVIRFDSGLTCSATVNQTVPLGKSLSFEIPITIKRGLSFPKGTDSVSSSIAASITATINGTSIHGGNSFSVGVCKNIKPELEENEDKPWEEIDSSVQYDQTALASAVNEMKNIKAVALLDADSNLTTLNRLLTSQQKEAIGQMLIAEVAMATAPKETFEDTLSDKIISKVFGYKKIFTVFGSQITIKVGIQTEAYGEVIMNFICDYIKPELYGDSFGFNGPVKYEIVGGSGMKKLPRNMGLSGTAGIINGYNFVAFSNALYKFAESGLKSAFMTGYGNTENEIVDFLFGKTINEFMKRTNYGSVAGLTWQLMITPAKKTVIYCPVDVYVFNAEDKVVASVENNQVTNTDQQAMISVEGDVKTVWLYDDSYRIGYVATAEDTMRVDINEYGTSEGLLRTVTIDSIPLVAGETFSQSIDNIYLNNSDYTIYSDELQYNSTSEKIAIHAHDSNEFYYDEIPATCNKAGFAYTFCSICNGWFIEKTGEPLGHVDLNTDGYCDNCSSLIPETGVVIAEGSCGDNVVFWTLYESGKLVINGQGTMKSSPWRVLDPKIIRSVEVQEGVTNIIKNAFSSCSYVTTASIADTVTSIAGYAFSGCNKLRTINLPKQASHFGEKVFYDCGSLISVSIPAGITSIERGTFEKCVSLQSVLLPDSITQIGSVAFSSCTSLVTISLPQHIETLRYRAFAGCKQLSSVYIPQNIQTIETRSFLNCSSLADVFFGGSKTEWDKVDIQSDNEDLLTANIHFNESGDPHQHTYITILNVAPTCDHIGEESFVCDCGSSYTSTIPALGHVDENNDGYCDRDGCGEMMIGGEHCLKCGKIHNGGFFDKLTGFFHKLIYRLTHLFG